MRIISRLIVSLTLLPFLATQSSAQTEPTQAKTATGSISGRITAGGKAVAGVSVALQPTQANRTGLTAGQTGTDDDGNFSFQGIKPGSYQVVVLSPDLIAQAGGQGGLPGQSVILGEGGNVDSVNLSLARGGVITGTVVDSNGYPLISQTVRLARIDRTPHFGPMTFDLLPARNEAETDDRGIYRVFGVLPGKYRVSVGEETGGQLRREHRPGYARTFHPETTDESSGTVIEVGEGTEATGIDIRLAPPLKTYAVSGHVIDAETRQPAAGVRIDYITDRGYAGEGPVSSSTGEFRWEGFFNGSYSLKAGEEAESERYSEPQAIEVNGADVSGVQLVLKRGGSISGVVVIEGTNDPALRSRLSETSIAVSVQTDRTTYMARRSQFKVAADGRFRIGGLRPGKVRLSASGSLPLPNLVLTRIECNGVAQSQGIPIEASEQVTGVRLVLGYASGSVEGQVVAAPGTFPEGTVFSVWAKRLEPGALSYSAPSILTDPRGNFLIRNLVPGQHEVVAMPAFQPSPQAGVAVKPPATAKQTVTVVSGLQSRITISISPQERQQ